MAEEKKGDTKSPEASMEGATKEGSGEVVYVLYAKPGEEKPYVTISSLQKGQYQECSFYSIRYFIPFSDVGKLFYDVIRETVPDIKIKLENVNFLENNHEYELTYKGSNFSIKITSNRYRAFPFSYVKTFYLKFEISGSVEAVQPVFAKFVSKRGNLPIDFDDWQKLSSAIKKTKEEVENDWKTLLSNDKQGEGKKTLSKLSSLLNDIDNIPEL